jgi:hypothetical protein
LAALTRIGIVASIDCPTGDFSGACRIRARESRLERGFIVDQSAFRAPDCGSQKKGGRTATIFRIAFLSIGSVALSACDLHGAPSYSIFGAYFPAWLLCSAIGILGSVALRAAVVASGLEDAIPLRLLIYVSFATAVALWLWLSLFGGQ